MSPRISNGVNLLAIETSGPVLSVAVKKSGGKLRHATVRGHMKHAENLLPAIDRLLKKERLEIGNIDAYLISRGPGSFTGLRIGFATLKGFLATRPKTCYGALSVDVIAAGVKDPRSSNLNVCVDARRGKLYTRSYRYHGKRWVPRGPCQVIPIGEMASIAEQTRIVGDGLAKIDPKAIEAMPGGHGVPRAATLIELFEAKDPLLKKLKNPKDLLPVYLRRSEPEEKLLEKKRS